MDSNSATTGYNSMSGEDEGNLETSGVLDQDVTKRLQKYKDAGKTSSKQDESRALMGNEEDKEDSDLENNVNRLCQYLSGGSDAETEESPELSRRGKFFKASEITFPVSSLIGESTSTPQGHLYALAGRRRDNYLLDPNRRYSTALSERSSSSSPSTAPISDENNSSLWSGNQPISDRHRPISGTLETVLMNSGDSTELQQFQPSVGYNPRRVGKPVFPQDFLNIPPPDHPPDASPTSEHRSMPLPPQRPVPPVPVPHTGSNLDQSLEMEEPQYEEAKPPATALRPHGKNAYQAPPSMVMPQMSGMNGYELSNSALNRVGRPTHQLAYIPESQRYNEIDWAEHCRVLATNPETGSVYIPSGHTTMSSLSPQSGRTDLDASNKHSYSFLPAAGTTVPVSVMPMRPEHTGSSGNTAPNHALKTRASLPSNGGNSVRSNSNFQGYAQGGYSGGNEKKPPMAGRWWSWKCMAYSLAMILVFALAVIVYLLYSLLSDSTIPHASPPSYGINSGGKKCSSTGVFSPTLNPVIPLRPLPESFSLGDPVVADLPPQQLVYTYFNLQRDSWVQFNLSVEPTSKLALYGRQTLPPTPTQRDWVKIISGENLHAAQPVLKIVKRSAMVSPYGYPVKNLRNTLFVQFLVAGRWHLGFLNDDSNPSSVKFAAALRRDSGEEDCKYGCYGKGVCKDGKCYCFEGFTGPYCEETICPVLCSGNGIFTGGSCHCHQGWKGPDCDTPDNVCEIPNCYDHGRCNSRGECDCEHGWTGNFCELEACPHANCSGHGVCVDGKCYCEFGWKGQACDETYTAQGLCPESEKCSKRGTWDALNGACRCELGWTGEECQIKLCNIDCGPNGRCEEDRCVCSQKWTGPTCDSLACLPGCEEHGRCDNGTCRCEKGWNGDNCQLDGCRNGCNERGECRQAPHSNVWLCECSPDFSGSGCTVPMELQCDDGKDNDNDGLVDCADSECCNAAPCRNDMMCRSVPDPQTILIREQTPPPQASFFKKVRFLLISGVQEYAELKLFNETRVSVIQGRVLHPLGGPLKGVRISDKENALYGFTISRAGGKFDLVVNGGGSVTLQFMRQPYGSILRTLQVPWNGIVTIHDIIMTDTAEISSLKYLGISCAQRQREHWIRPYLLPSWLAAKHGGPPLSGNGEGKLVADSRTVHESLRLPGTSDLYLSYSSGQAEGYQSSLSLYLLPEDVPEQLRLVKLKIHIAGVRFEKTLVAKPNLTYWYGWDKRNVYNRKVYGLTIATVAVGYVYAGCGDIFWEKATAKLNGFKSGATDLGGWNLNIHHHFDVQDGVLEKGDGSTVYVNEEPPVVVSTMGNGRQRPLNCPFCNTKTTDVSLFQPLALASAKDGSLYVGDYNLIRKITPNGTVATVMELSPSDNAHKYYLAVHPVTDELYLSLPLRRQIWKLKTRNSDAEMDGEDTTDKFEVMVGSGKSCVYGEKCGDGGPARMASLTFPKGMAFDSQGTLYFADERRVRMVHPTGIIQTILGGEGPGSQSWKPLPCLRDFQAKDLALQWPTALAVDRLSDNLLILDSDMVFKMASLDSARLVVGAPPHCAELTDSRNRTTRAATLTETKAIAVDAEGGILAAESDGKRINRIRSFDAHGRSDLVAGAESNCDCHPQNCPCDDIELTLAKNARLHLPEALAVDSAGLIHVADQGNFKIKTVKPMKPEWDNKRNLYEIYSGDSQEVFLFNKFGQHVTTKSLLSNEYLYNFTYDVDTSYGRLVHVTGLGLHRLYMRKIASEVQIETSQSRKAIVKLSQFNRMMESFTNPDGGETKFDYDTNTGLLISRKNPDGTLRFYNYDDYGHAISATTSTGDVIDVEETVFKHQRVSVVKRNAEKVTEYRTTGWEINENGALVRTTYMLGGASTFYVNTEGAKAQFDSSAHSLLPPHETTLMKQKLQIFPLEKPAPRPELITRLEWRYYLRREGGPKNREKKSVIKVNGLNVISVEHNRKTNVDSILNSNGNPILKINYNSAGAAVRYEPESAELSPMNITMDPLGRIVEYNRGDKVASFVYDGYGRVVERSFGTARNVLQKKFTYETSRITWPNTVQMASGAEYLMKYDTSGNLLKLETPSTEEHRFAFLSEFGFGLSLRYTPVSGKPFLVARNDKNKPVAVVYPDNIRRVTLEYDTTDRLKSIWHDQSSITYDYIQGADNVQNINYRSDVDGGYEKSFVHQGPLLVEEYRVEKDQRGNRLAAGHFSYTHDDLLRVTSIRASFGDQITMEPIQFSYDSGSGRIDKLGRFSVKYATSKIRFQGDNVYMDEVIDPIGRVAQTSLGIRGRKVCQLSVTRDEIGRVTGITGFVNSDAIPDTRITYNVDGHLNQLSVGKQKNHKWTVHYDLDGRVKAVNNRKVNLEKGTVKKFGDLIYETDESGFVVARGNQQFYYDSFGRLMRASQNQSFDIHYRYDEQHRLIEKKSGSQKLHLYYAIQDKPNLVTHIYESGSGMVTVYHYDLHDRLFVVETSGSRYYVQTAPDRSPIYVFSDNGNLEKSIIRGPFGEIIQDSNPGLVLYVGFGAMFQDPETDLVIYGGRPMDTLIGRWMSVSVERLMEAIDPFRPETADLWSWEREEKRPDWDLKMDASDWIQLSGLHLDRVVPLLDNSVARSALSHDSLCPDNNRVILGVECNLRKRIGHFQQFLTSDTSKILPKTPYSGHEGGLSWSVVPSVYGDGIVVKNESNLAVLELAASADSLLQEAMIVLLNESMIVPVMNIDVDVVSGLPVVEHFFFKQGAIKSYENLAELGIQSDKATLTRQLNVTVEKLTPPSGGKASLLRVNSKFAALTIFYGESLQEAKEYFSDEQLKRTSSALWLREKEAALKRFDWSEKELKELRTNGRVEGFLVRRRAETDSLFLAGDSNFLQWEKTLRRRK